MREYLVSICTKTSDGPLFTNIIIKCVAGANAKDILDSLDQHYRSSVTLINFWIYE